jgi:hypothetical protein
MSGWTINLTLALILGMVLTIGYGTYQHEMGLREACTTLGGVYIDSQTCVAGKNLFVEK